MGNYLAVDSKSSTLRDFVGVHLEGIRTLKQPAAPEQARHHLKVWRVYESGAGIQYDPVTFELDELSSFSFISTEAYVVLLTSKLPEQQHSQPLPIYFWATLQSTDSLAVQSLSTALFTITHENYRADLYLFKGKWVKPPVSITALGLAFEVEGLLKRGGQHLLGCVFKGMYVEKNRVQHCDLLAMSTKEGEIPGSAQLLAAFDKKKVIIFQRLYPKQEKKAVLALPMNSKIPYQSKFKFKQTPRLEQIQPSNPFKIKPNKDFENPFEVEITQIRQHGIIDEHSQQLGNQFVIDDFEKQLQQSLALRQGNRLKTPQIDEQQQLAAEQIMNYADFSCQKVIDGLFISGQKAAYNLQQLKKNNITLVINVAADYCMNKFRSEVAYMSFFAKDAQTQNIECIFYQCIEAIDQQIQNKGNVLVHCVRGVSRSAAVVTAYLICKLKMTYEKAEKLLRSKRPQASPNTGFMLQLINFDKRVNTKWEQQPFKPKVFGVGSYQLESPNLIVAKHITEPLCKNSHNGLDSRGYFIIQHSHGFYLWKGSKCPNPQSYLKACVQHIRLLSKYQPSLSSSTTHIQQSQHPPASHFLQTLNLSHLPAPPSTNSSMLYLNPQSKHIPAGALNPQVLVFQLGNTVPLDHSKLSEEHFYLRCKEDRTGVKIVMWDGAKWAEDEAAVHEFLVMIRDLYYGDWDESDIFLHQRNHQFSESFGVEHNL